jgi:hypothetical protein
MSFLPEFSWRTDSSLVLPQLPFSSCFHRTLLLYFLQYQPSTNAVPSLPVYCDTSYLYPVQHNFVSLGTYYILFSLAIN